MKRGSGQLFFLRTTHDRTGKDHLGRNIYSRDLPCRVAGGLVGTERTFGNAGRGIQIGFWVNAFLMIMKQLAGYFGRSEAVFADGMESAEDFIALGSSMIALRIGSRPFDEAVHAW